MASFTRKVTKNKIRKEDVNELQASLEQRGINVMDPLFGAKGDGVNDDTAAFQSAINAAIAVKGKLFIPAPPVTWRISNLTIQPASGAIAFMNIEAHGPNGSIAYIGGSDAAVFSCTGWKYSSVTGLRINLVGNPNDVAVFDILGDATSNSSGVMDWTNCLFGLGTGKACRGWRFGRDLSNRDVSFMNFINCSVQGQGANTLGHIGWQNLSSDMLTNKWINCAGSGLSFFYSGTSGKTRINGAIDSSVTTITVDETTGWASQGRVKIDTEEIAYTGKTATTITGCTRGVNGTTAASHVDDSITEEGIKRPVGTFGYDIIGGGGHEFISCGGTLNWRVFLLRAAGEFKIIGGRWEGVTRFLQAAFTQSSGIAISVDGTIISITSPPADNIIFALGNPGVLELNNVHVYNSNQTAAFISANGFDSWGAALALGSVVISNCQIQSTVDVLWTLPTTWFRKADNVKYINSASQPQGVLAGAATYGRRVSADVGNAAKTLLARVDEPTQRWNTAITADRAVTLSTTGAVNGDRFRIVRTAAATGAFNVNVGTGPLKALAAATWAEVEFDGTAWLLTAFGSL